MKRLFIVSLFFIGKIYGQAPVIEWQNRFGGNDWNLSLNSNQTQDGGYIFGGRSNSNISGDKTEDSRGGNDYWIVKANSLGMFEWDKTIGGGNPNGFEEDRFSTINQTLDGGYIISGYSDSPISGDKIVDALNGPNYFDFWIIKTDSNGIIQWQKVIGGNYDDVVYTLKLTADGGYILGGYSDSDSTFDKSESCRGLQDYWIIKIDSLGNVEWNKTIGGNSNDILNCIIQTTDGGYLLGGRSNSNISGDKTEDSKGNSDYWVLKIDSIGNIQWQKTIGGSGFDELTKVIQLPNGDFFLSGYSNSPISGDKTEPSRGGYDFWGVKINVTGTILWQKTIGGDNNDYLSALFSQNDNKLILFGTSSSSISGEKTAPSIGGYDAWIIKMDLSGNVQWQKVIGGTNDDQISNFIQTADGGYLLSGITNSPISGDITIAPKGVYDYWAVKLGPDNLSINQNEQGLTSFSVYPNPTNDYVNIHFNSIQEKVHFSLINLLGQTISSKDFSQIQNTTYDIVGEKGIYFLSIEDSTGRKKIIKVIKN